MTERTGLLAGVRIVEVSMLGPAAITTALADLGAEVIKVETAAGDYVRQMTWPIVEGVSLMHLHVNRGKRSIVIDLRTEEGVAALPRPRARRGRRGRGDAPRRARPARPQVRAHAGGQPDDRAVHHLGLRRDRPVPGPREPRHRVRRRGPGSSRPRSTRTATRASRTTCRSASTRARCSARSASSPRSSRPARPAKAPSSSSRSPTRPPRSTGTAARRTAPTSGRSPRSPATSPTTTCAASPRSRGCAAACATSVYASSDGYVLFMASEQHFWKKFCEARRARRSCSSSWPGSQYGDHARGNLEMQAELTDDLQDEDDRGVGATSASRSTCRSRRSTRRTRCRTTRSSSTGWSWFPADVLGADQLPFPVKVAGEEPLVPAQGAGGRRAHRRGPARRPRLRRRQDRRPPRRRRHHLTHPALRQRPACG